MLIAAFLTISFACAYAERMAPKPIAPIDHNDVTYSVPHFVQFLGDDDEQTQNGGYVLARDKKTKRIKWLVQIYVTKYNKFLESDVQDVFITEIKLKDDTLIIKDEKGRNYSLNINTLEVKPISPL